MKRLLELDSIRGLAALSVLIGHYQIYKIFELPQEDILKNSFLYWYNYSPLHILHAGNEAVILFFILSGFVLTTSYLNSKKISLVNFIIKRLSRIYIPVFVMLFFALFLKYLLYTDTNFTTLSIWINSKWREPVTIKMLFDHFTLIFQYIYSNGINPVLWSLTHELRFYILFPFVIYFLVNVNILGAGIIILSSMVIGYEGLVTIFKLKFITQYGLHVTLIYIPTFISGIFLAKYFITIKELYQKYLNIYFKILILIIATILYTYSWLFPSFDKIHNAYYDYSAIILGSCLFIISGLSSKRISGVLSNKILVFFGKISFSLYLYHFVILLATLNIFYNIIPTWVILGIAVLFTILISFISYKYIEIPSINFVKKLIGS